MNLLKYKHIDEAENVKIWLSVDPGSDEASDGNQISHYIYDANGERAMKYNGTLSKQQINQYTLIDYALMDRYTYYPSPLLVFGSSGYSKHYFIEGQRMMSRIGDIWDAEAALIPLDTTPDGVDLNNKADQIEAQLETHLACLALAGEVDYHVDLEWLGWETEPMVFFYHPDHLGSSSFITGATGEPTQHLEYLPFGELFIEERSTWNTPYKFSGKELDDETGYSYFGARYYDPNISIWLSVDPLSDKNPNTSPYSYCINNPIRLVDPDGRDWYESESGAVIHQNNDAKKIKIDGETFRNIGEAYSHTVGNTTYNYNQNTVETIEFTTDTRFQAQTTGTGCKIAADNMVRSSGATPSTGRAGEILMANHDANGVVTTPSANAAAGVNRIEGAIMDGHAITIGVDYKPKQQHNLRSSGGDGMTDHFVTMVGMTYNLRTGNSTFRFFDPGSPRNGNNISNTMSLQGGFLQGRTASYNQPFKVTTVRQIY